MTVELDLQELYQLLGHSFAKPELLQRALTHSSTNEGDYERLEFVGDRVVNLITADLIYRIFPDETEGDMARRHTALVRGETLAKAAKRTGLDKHVRLSDSEAGSGGRENDHILADIMESVTAALYLDAGLAKAHDFVASALGDDLKNMSAPPMDPKTQLQEWSQAKNIGLPDYSEISRTGPDHAPVFMVEVTLPGYPPAQGEGPSKRVAEKNAAANLLKDLPL